MIALRGDTDLNDGGTSRQRMGTPDQQAVLMNVFRVEVREEQLAVWLKVGGTQSDAANPSDKESPQSLAISR